jgi:hypothetical protein
MNGRHTDAPTNFLGHSCSIEPLLRDHKDQSEYLDAQKEDPRLLVQRICGALDKLNERVMDCHETLSHLHGMADGLEDGQRLASVLRLSADHALHTSNQVHDFTGQLLALLQRQGLIEASRRRESAAGARP